MSSLFADTHNVVAILAKSDVAEGFKQIIDFLSGSYIYYALTVNPHIYISCIKKFWNTASVKRSGNVTRLQALVNKKKIVISEVVIHEILQLDDAEGVVCLPNEEIFVDLAQMRYEKPTSWNEFSTAMASVVICLSKGQMFNFSKYIFDSLVRNVDSSSKFYMVGKGFSRVKTPLFEEMLTARQPIEEGLVDEQVQVDDVVAAVVEENVVEDKLVIIKLKARVKKLEMANKFKSSKLRRLRKVGASKQVESSDAMEDVFNQGRMIDDMDKDEEVELVKDADIAESEGRHDAAQQAKRQVEIYHIDLDHSSKVLNMQEDDSEVQEVVEPSIPAAALTVVTAYTRRRKGVIIRDPKEDLSTKTLAETPKVKDKDKGILVETPKPMKKKDQIELDAKYARKLHEEINRDHDDFNKDIDWDAAIDHTESEARKNMMIYLKNTAGYKMDFFKRMTYAQICPIFQAMFDENMRFLFKSREEMEEEDQEIIKSINETPAQKAVKRRKLSEEAQEAKDLRKRLEVVDDDDDDVFIEATPLARKVPVVDYQIVLVDNKPRFMIIKANETHQLYINFTTLLKNFDREDLENLWEIVREIFSTSKLTNFSDEYLLLTLKTMFKKPDEQDAVWKNQRSVYGLALLLELMLSKRSKKNTKCVNAVNEELTTAKHKLMLLVYCC
nr:hypothetical protein [Tanacetum cinerariifolium]